MNITDILNEQRTRLDVPAASKKRVLETLSEMLAATASAGNDGEDGEENPPAPDRHAIFEGLCAREKLGSTGLGHGVGLPHARLGGLSSPMGALLRLSDTIDYDSPDRAGVDLVFALLVPEESTEDHLQLLAQIASRFSDDELRDALRNCGTPEQAIGLMTGAQAHE